MQDIHDELRIPLTPEPEPRSFLDSIRNWLSIGRARRTKREDRQAKAAAANREFRAAEARRREAQPGIADRVSSVFGRIGKGEGFADLALLPAISLACLAIVRALAALS